MNVRYQSYIQSDEWRRKADAAKKRAGYRCQVCNAGDTTLDAHHRTYERLGHEAPEDITVLCRNCHELYETNRKRLGERIQVQPVTINDAKLWVRRQGITDYRDYEGRGMNVWATYSEFKGKLVRELDLRQTRPGDSKIYDKWLGVLVRILEVYPGEWHQ